MRYLTNILLLCTPLVSAEQLTQWQDKAIQERHAAIRAIRNICSEVDEILLHLNVNDTPNAAALENTDMPQGAAGETVAEADGGMLFDAANSRVTYINNVRVSDARALLRCARRLYVQLPQSSLTERQEGAREAINHNKQPSRPAPKQPAVVTEKTASEPTVVAEEIPGLPMADAPATIAVPVDEPPINITTDEAVIDSKKNCILLTGSTNKSPGLHLRRGQNEVTLQATRQGGAPIIMADANGDILINSGKIYISWQDREGQPCSLHSEADTIYYRAAEHSLLINGKTNLRTPQGTLAFTKGAVINLEPADTAPTKDGFMSQFTNVRIAGITRAEAWGEVVATSAADSQHPAGEIHGDHLIYDAKTGTCLTEGSHCKLVYGRNTIQTDGSLRLEPNGDIYLSGTEITGTYERTSPQDGKTAIQGQFRTADTLVFSAAEQTITAPKGITLRDDFTQFACTGALILTLQKSATARNTPSIGNLNLAIAQYDDISYACASGQVVLHHGDTPGKADTVLQASEAELNLLTGEGTLTAGSGQVASIHSQGYELTATSAKTPALVELAANGDIHITGEQITAQMVEKDGATRIQAYNNLHLTRATGELKIGPNSRITSPDGILTANGPLTATLHPGAPNNARPVLPRYPHLVYNYDGLSKAYTPQGGTIRTEQASMQCTGPITVELNPNPPVKSNSPTAAIKHATAEGKVAIAGKDSTGRLITAAGDKATLNGATGEKRLTGRQVTLADAYNIHTAYGPGAQVIIDKKNNARITGARHSTTATRIPDQIEQQKKK